MIRLDDLINKIPHHIMKLCIFVYQFGKSYENKVEYTSVKE